ncbi:MAG: hypothetical protein ABEJ72_01055, partial [Candidatus Aenigmatarchaeota archaeon]
MDRYDRISVVYILLPFVVYGSASILGQFLPSMAGTLSGLVTGFNLLFLVYHLVYIKLTLDDTRENSNSRT